MADDHSSGCLHAQMSANSYSCNICARAVGRVKSLYEVLVPPARMVSFSEGPSKTRAPKPASGAIHTQLTLLGEWHPLACIVSGGLAAGRGEAGCCVSV